MTKEREELLSEALTKDADFTKKIIAQGTPEMKKALDAKGYDFSETELEEFGEIVKEAAKVCFDENGELTEEALEMVNGGMSKWDKFKAGVGIVLFIGLAFAVGY